MPVKKPVLTLPNRPAPPPPPPSPPPQPETGDAYAEIVRAIIVEELDRAKLDKTVALAATMARIAADEALFRRLATILIRQVCRKRIKRITRAWAQAAEQAMADSE